MSYNEELQSNNDALRGILDEVNTLPDGTGGVQPDYAQNDPAARDFIKNRPFYDSREWVAVHTEAETSPFGDTPTGQKYSTFTAASPNIFDLYPVGTTVRCVIDGAEYVSVIRESEVIGNYGLASGGIADPSYTGEDFCLFAVGSSVIGVCVKDKPAGAYKVSVYALEGGEIHQINPMFLPDRKPIILDASLSDYYGGHPEAGDTVLEAIKQGQQSRIMIRVPNASGDNYVASYSPVYFTQLPLDGQYLYLFYLRDEKQDLSALVGQPAGTVVMPTYGQLMMLLSQRYDSDPLED